jgi:hypothetical protein
MAVRGGVRQNDGDGDVLALALHMLGLESAAQ